MKRYVIEREIPSVGSFDRAQLRDASKTSNTALAELAPRVQWEHSYVAGDKTFCIYLAEDEAAMDVAEDHRLSIDRWFYPCSYEMHTALATTYVSDPLFRQHYEDVAVGLADYLSAAITANALRMTQG